MLPCPWDFNSDPLHSLSVSIKPFNLVNILLVLHLSIHLHHLPVEKGEHVHHVVAGGGPLHLVVVGAGEVPRGVECKVGRSSMNLNETPGSGIQIKKKLKNLIYHVIGNSIYYV